MSKRKYEEENLVHIFNKKIKLDTNNENSKKRKINEINEEDQIHKKIIISSTFDTENNILKEAIIELYNENLMLKERIKSLLEENKNIEKYNDMRIYPFA